MSRMCGSIPPLPQYAFMVWCSVKEKKAQGQLYLYLLPYSKNFIQHIKLHITPGYNKNTII
jgi:hypothetical protein